MNYEDSFFVRRDKNILVFYYIIFMKERSWVYAKILFLILSINLFLCTDIVECTERLLTIVNLSLGKNKLSILNPFYKSDYKLNNGIMFGVMSDTEKKEDYIANFLQYIHDNEKNAVFLEIIFTMDKSWEDIKLFEKLKSTDEAIIFNDLGWFLRKYKKTLEKFYFKDVCSEICEKDKELRKLDNIVITQHSNMDLIVKRYYVITSEEKLQMLVNIIEKGIIAEFGNKYEYISYSFKPLYPDLDLDLEFKNVFNLVDYPSLQNKNDKNSVAHL